MAVGELFLSAFIQVLFDRLAPRELLQFALQDGVLSELENWKPKLHHIDALLIDAEQKQLTSRAEKLWLDDLRDLAYDAEDILDEFAFHALECRLMAENCRSRVQNMIPTCFTCLSPRAIRFKVSIKPKIEEINSRLDKLCEKRNLGLTAAICGSSSSAPYRRVTQTCVPNEPAVYGRDEDKARILEMMFRDEPSSAKFRVITIVGMGGIGKTTLAREVYNDKEVKDFNPKVWVSVSYDFDVLRISKAILESINLYPCSLMDLNPIQLALTEQVRDKKFLLLLDDVWSEADINEKWESLKSPFMVGALGSKIIVTTRHKSVASTMGNGECYNLELLSDHDCWAIFNKHAFQEKDIDPNGISDSVREKIVEKCRGLPLAAKTLGGLLRSEEIHKWKSILDEKLSDENNTILPVLRLSYSHLPFYLKRCFAYCAIFPKNYEFIEKHLIFLWMTQGLIQPSETNKNLEEIGGMYFHNLLSRSLFQKSGKDGSTVIMHDLVHDLALWVSQRTCLELNNKLDHREECVNMARYSSYTSSNYDGKHKFEVLSEAKRIRTFLPLRLYDDGTRYITSLVVYDILPKLKKLRMLSLATYNITKLPDSIGSLIHLRYLNLSQTKIRYLPESTSSLYNLQIFLLTDCCFLLKLPTKMRNLINLRHLDISGANLISEMPLGMKYLTRLQTLSNFIVGKGIGSGLEDLKYLKDLGEKLCISKLENSQCPRALILGDKDKLKVLVLEWSPDLDNSRDKAAEKYVLEMLQPHEKLEELTIKYYAGTEFPPWVGDCSLSSTPVELRVLRLESCKNCTSLPSLGLFTSLKELTIKDMAGIKQIGSEIYGEGSFQSLENLYFDDMEEWEHWDPIDQNETIQIFPRLQKLSIKNCPKLSRAPLNHLQSLEKLVIFNCLQLVASFLGSLPRLCELEIDGCKEMTCNSLTGSKSLKSMTLSDFSEFGNWLRLEPSTLTSLQSLCIPNCRALTSLPEGLKNFSHLECLENAGCDSLTSIVREQLPSSLKRFSVSDCMNLQCVFDSIADSSSSMSNESSLDYMSISNCPTLKCLSLEGQSFAELKTLEIWNCPLLISLSPRGELPAAIKHLQIWKCTEFTTLVRDKLPEMIEFLQIDRCPKLESIAGRFHNNLSLRFVRISNCKKLQSFPDGLQSLSGLHGIEINDCPSLVFFPQGGLPTSIFSVSIRNCEKLGALPGSMNKLNCLQELTIHKCPRIRSIPAESLPINLTSLSVENQNTSESSLVDWKLQRLRSLKHLSILGCSDAVCFPPEKMILPSSLIKLDIQNFQKLKDLFPQGFESLTCLEHLLIGECPLLASLPKGGLPSSLLQLRIFGCPVLEKRCRRNKGKDWSKISHIPFVEIDHKFIYEE
ncbi:putative disease resistance RPP13-like protein 1 [Mangifera indica]|uniref:putative disease resistance RPP13-like protein 1 n=1 Tax=Mangifera indica TaxID=29780 RepID=UPI001CFB5669|nr:putative disease resistance RPP13-like protein 1 [Mangifera indica]